jgi:hypothetical protein
MQAISSSSLRVGSALSLVAVVPAFAHHSFAVLFDADKSVVVRGVEGRDQFAIHPRAARLDA